MDEKFQKHLEETLQNKINEFKKNSENATAEQIEALRANLQNEINKVATDKIDVNALNEKLKTLENTILLLNNSVEEMGKKEVKRPSEKFESLSLKEVVYNLLLQNKELTKKQFNKDTGVEEIVLDGEALSKKGFELKLKLFKNAAVDMTQDNTIAGVSIGSITNYTKKLTIPAYPYQHVTDVLDVQLTSNAKSFGFKVMITETDGVGYKTQGSNSTAKSSFLVKTVQYTFSMLETFYHVAYETVADDTDILNWIGERAPNNILMALDTAILAVNGTDSETGIAGLGVATKSTAFDATTYAGESTNNNLIDVIIAAAKNVEDAGYMPNVVIMSSTLYYRIGKLKDQNDNSIIDRRLTFDAQGRLTSIAGMTVMKTTKLADPKTVYVLDNSLPAIGLRDDITLQADYSVLDKMWTLSYHIRVALGSAMIEAVQKIADIDADLAEMNVPAPTI